MSVQVEKLEHNMAKLTIEVEASKFDAAMKKAYNKKKGSFNLPGFRKGKVPMYIIEKEYGAGRNSDWKRTELHLYSRSSCKTRSEIRRI